MSREAVEDAWRIHAALNDWTARVDTKASIALTLESAALAAFIVASGPERPFGLTSSYMNWLGVLLILLAIVSSIAAVTPRIKVVASRNMWEDNYIYFGHLQYWQPQELAERLCSDDILPVLARQMVVMSKIAWRKHRLVQVSFWSAAIGFLLIALGSVIAGLQ